MGNSPTNQCHSQTYLTKNNHPNSAKKKSKNCRLTFSSYVDHIRNTFQKPTCIDLSTVPIPNSLEHCTDIVITCSLNIAEEVATSLIQEIISRLPKQSINLTLSYSALELFIKVVKVLPPSIKSFKLMTLVNPQMLSDFLSIPNSLEVIDLTRVLLKENIYFIVEPLIKISTLRVLKLGGNLIGEFGAMDIANIIRKSPYLNEIEIWGNELSSNGLIKICEALMQNKNISKINIDSNNIGDDAIFSLCKCINQMVLKHVSLNSNCITSKGAIIIAHGLSKCNNLDSLCLNTNKISNHGAAYLIKLISRAKLSLYIDLSTFII